MWGFIFLILFLVVLGLALAANAKKIGPFFQNLKKFFGEVQTEMRKVVWPTQDEVVNSTILVVVSVFVLTIMVWIVDLVIGFGVQILFRNHGA